MPKISIIVPIYKVEKYLSRCVDSILNQTFTDFECILVDDGSPDNCPEICDEYAKRDKRIRVIHKQNGGLSDARNAGIDIAQGEYFGFVDSDDWIHPQMYEILYNSIARKNVLLSVCAYEQVEEERTFEKIENPIFEIENGMDFLVNDHVTAVVAWNKLYHKSLFDDIRYPIDKLHEDEFVTYRILYKSGNIAFCRKKMYMYFMNPEGITKGDFSPKHLDALDALEERIRFFEDKGEIEYSRRTIFVFLLVADAQYHKYEKCKEYRYACREVSKRMRNILRSYAKSLDINFIKNSNYYCLAYPCFAPIILLIIDARQLIKRFWR